MSGLCGWFGRGRTRFDPDGVLEAMAGLLPTASGATRRSAAPGAGVALTEAEDRLHWHATESLQAAALGDLRWTDPDAAAAARERGHGWALSWMYERKGAKLLDDLCGSFSLAVLDRERNRALLAIDRMGIGTLCYARPEPGLLLFGSGNDPLLAHPADQATIEPQAIFDYFYFIDRVPAPHCVYSEHRKLLPGHCLVVDDGEVREQAYWRMPYVSDGKGDPGELAEELLALLRQALKRSLEGEAPARTGVFLSGGLDSSTVLGLFAEAAEGRPKAFTIGFDEEGMDETPYARIAAEWFGAEHDIYYLQPEDVVEAVPRIAASYDEPFANSSAIPAFYCALRAQQSGVAMLLAGDGGDELFAGNSRYVNDAFFDKYQRLPGVLRSLAIEPALALPLPADLTLVRKLRNYVKLAKTPLGARLTINNLYHYYEPGEVFSAEACAAIEETAPARLADQICRETPSSSKLQRMMNLDLRITLADSDLRKVGRMCELAGVRVRYPFLDDDLVAFSARVPPDLLLEGGALRAFYKKALADFLPAEIIQKQKMGFGMPYLQLMRSYRPLSELVCDSLQSLKTRGFFRDAFLDAMTDGVRHDRPLRFGGVLWDLMVLELWFASRSKPQDASEAVGAAARARPSGSD